ncbi:MAG TPA: hypothetical protein VFG10_16430 [Saprospiraceae bacterium]|nr:hypothetical protein [Saprospiraceae bacterium]
MTPYSLFITSFVRILMFIIPFSGISQSIKVIVFRAIDADQSQVIGQDGKVLFKIPARDNPVLENCAQVRPSKSQYQFFDFAEGPIPVYRKDSLYLIDQNGKRLLFLDKKYIRICNPSQGLIRVAVANDDYKKPEKYSFLDRTGKSAFGGKEFSSATLFKEGFAVVKPWPDSSSWQIMNLTGEVVYSFPADMSKYISAANEFSSGLSMITINAGNYGGSSKQQQNIYVDPTGKEVLNMKNVTGAYNGYMPRDFIGNLAYLRSGYDFTFFNKEGKIIRRNISALEVHMNDQWVLLPLPENSTAVKHLYDHQWKETPLPKRSNSLVEFAFLTDHDLGIYVLDTVTKAFSFELLDKQMNSLFQTDKVVMDVKGGMVIIGNPLDGNVAEIHNLENKVLFGVAPGSKIFESFKEALPMKEQVEHLSLTGENGLGSLCPLSKLRTLEIKNFEGKSIPVCIGYMQQLSEFTVSNALQLEELPKSLSKAPALEKLHLSNCPAVTNLAEIIDGCKKLKVVTLLDMKVEDGLLERLKASRPSLNINAWYTSPGN